MIRNVSTESHPDSLVEAPPEDATSPVPAVTPVTCSDFLQIVEEVKLAIAEAIYPVRIAKGSSGSYFCYSRKREIVGVFKPKNEEPYGQMNPKWVKWAHRTFLPCCFGRSCIIPNLGYLSEAGASYLDRRLGLNVVPRTEVVILSSPSFHYGRQDIQAWKSGKPLPGKIGSFQLFLKGFKDATEFFKEGYDRLGVSVSNSGPSTTIDIDVLQSQQPSNPAVWSDQMRREFQWGFERLVCLDYLIRNTDRGLDNWMVKQSTDPEPSSSTESTSTQPHVSIQVAGIDNGLAFPHKHPDHFRSYPFGWTLLPCADVPFSAETRGYILHHLTSEQWWRDTVRGLRELFSIDPDFDSRMFSRQMGVVRGQGYNLVEVLRRAELARRSGVTGTRQSVWNAQATPVALAKRPVVCVYEEEADALPDPPLMLSRMNSPRFQGANTVKRFESFDTVKPVFRSW
ncbi:phosphatidylinositol 4-kinase type 2-beta-like protein [Cladochytrium replicatum]|nr:phosphatidylinositol 4-kinase type 2-beta-like protein [Cladochytrium replicatum]